MKIPVPAYLLEGFLRRYRTLAQRGVFDRTDTKSANALRKSRSDINRIERLISKNKENERPVQKY